jgi:hypothetical protein
MGSVLNGTGAVSGLPREELVDAWIKAHKGPPPKGISRRLLEYSAAYHEQARALGGLKPTTRRKLRQIAASRVDGNNPIGKRKQMAPGSRLIREWQGQTHTVEVLEAGFLYDGQRYRSLSEIARFITGARWSGPRFFGS